MTKRKKPNTARPLNETLQAKINDSVLYRLRQKIEQDGYEFAEWIRETAELYLKGMLRRVDEGDPSNGPTDDAIKKTLEELAACRKEIASLKLAASHYHKKTRSDLAQFFVALLCNPTLLPDGMALTEAELGHLINCMFPDLNDEEE